jgi:hypothetical protein
MRKSLLTTVSLLAVLVFGVAGTCQNKAPKIPAKPSGPRQVAINDTATYASVTTDANRDKVLYAFDWGDGTAETTALFKSGDTATASHAWSAVGVYPVKVMAKDEKGLWSADWSDTLMVTVDSSGPQNNPPNAPAKPTHVGIDSIGKPIAVSTSTTDPDGDSVQIKFYFADGGTPTYGPKLASGATFTDTVTYNTNGWKVVYAVASDGRHFGALRAGQHLHQLAQRRAGSADSPAEPDARTRHRRRPGIPALRPRLGHVRRQPLLQVVR